MTVPNVKVTSGDRALSLAWQLPPGAYAALVKWREHPSGAWSVVLAVGAYEIAGLTNGISYDVQVVPVGATGVATVVGTPVGGSPPVPSPVPPPPVIS